MSGTLEAQLQALTTALANDMSVLSADLDTIIGRLTPGATITQADIDALAAVRTATDAAVAKAQAAVTPPAP